MVFDKVTVQFTVRYHLTFAVIVRSPLKIQNKKGDRHALNLQISRLELKVHLKNTNSLLECHQTLHMPLNK